MTFLLDRATRSEIARATATDKLEHRRSRWERKQALQDKREAQRVALHLKREARRVALRATARSFAAKLPARLILIPASLAAAAAWKGQADWATDPIHGLGWTLLWGIALASALETLGFATAAMARSARDHGDTAIVERAVMWADTMSAAYLNWTHSHQPVLGLMSISGVAGWEVYERRRHRNAIQAVRPAMRPRFGIARWLRFLPWTFAAWSISVRDRLGATDAAVALQRAEGERRSRHITNRSRRDWVSQVREFIDNERVCATERAERVLQEGNALLGAAALVFGPDVVRGATSDTAVVAPPSVAAPTRKRRRRVWQRVATRVVEGATPPEMAATELDPTATEADTLPAEGVTEYTATVTPIRSAPDKSAPAPLGEKHAAMLRVFRDYVQADRLGELNGTRLAREAGATGSFGRRHFPDWKRAVEDGVPLDEIGVAR